MNSINKNQPEKNRKDLRGARPSARSGDRQAGGKLLLLHGGPRAIGRGPAHERAAGGRRGEPVVPERQRQPQELGAGPRPSVRLYFQGSPHSDFLDLNGRASVASDQAKIEELWEPVIRTWFTEGVDDPRITVIKVTPSDGYTGTPSTATLWPASR